jgi:hypothetical protein
LAIWSLVKVSRKEGSTKLAFAPVFKNICSR